MKKETIIRDLNNKINKLREAKKTVLHSLDILESKEREELTYKTAKSLNDLINNYIAELQEVENRPPLYSFFYQYQFEGKRHHVTQRRTKRPEATKEYKTLKDNFNKGFIFSYGYEAIE